MGRSGIPLAGWRQSRIEISSPLCQQAKFERTAHTNHFDILKALTQTRNNLLLPLTEMTATGNYAQTLMIRRQGGREDPLRRAVRLNSPRTITELTDIAEP